MTAEDLIKAVTEGTVELKEGHTLVAVLVDENGRANMAGAAKPEVLKAIGVHFIEVGVRAEIKATL